MRTLLFYRDEDGTAPLIQWLDRIPSKARTKCMVRLERLAELGNQLRRPQTDYLGSGIHELRATDRGTHYLMLFVFHDGVVLVVSHGLSKEGGAPAFEIQRAVRRRWAFARDPKNHTFVEPAP
ncbi:MAG: type II toxin-antitoxin system RelE/ParE family toxin [Planctomycetota bacterium]|nr:type II toxin-antitoxin system RelE/ParE family toxin [Planctomycetota bacterium]